VLDKIGRVGYGVFRRRPSLSKLDFVRLYFRARYSLWLGRGDRAPTLAGPP
jgi:hypothetical protein